MAGDSEDIVVRRPYPLRRDEPRLSRITARAEFTFTLIDDPDGTPITFSGIVPMSVQIERNRPADADTCKVVVGGDVFPFDLGIIAEKSMKMRVVLYEPDAGETEGTACVFFGVVDDLDRDRYGLNVELQGRDLTAVPLGAKISEEMLKTFRLSDAMSVEQLVTSLVKMIPGSTRWRVEALSAVARMPGVRPPMIEPNRGAKVEKATAPAAAFSPGSQQLAAIVGPNDLTVWSAICHICAWSALVPEVRLDGDDNPTVVLVDASDLQNSEILRPFYRHGRQWRVLVDGDGVATLKETLTLSGGPARPDFVQVNSVDPRTGEGLSARWPPERDVVLATGKVPEDQQGTFQSVPAMLSPAALERIAKGGFEALAHNTLRVTVTVREPWSAGGGPAWPDLLTVGYGSAIEMASPSFERLAQRAGLETPQKILMARGVAPVVATRILEASARLGAMSLLFQVEGVSLSWAGGDSPSFECRIVMRRFMGTASLPIFDETALPRGAA